MTTIAQGLHAYVYPEPGQVYRVQATGVATVQVIFGAPSAVVTLDGNSQTFGPYDAPAKLRISANTAAADYTLIRAHYAELTQAQLEGGAVGVLASDNAGGAIEPDGDVPSLGGGGSSVTVVNDLTTGGTAAALSAEMGKTLQTTKLAATADSLADLLEAAPTADPASMARIQASVLGDAPILWLDGTTPPSGAPTATPSGATVPGGTAVDKNATAFNFIGPGPMINLAANTTFLRPADSTSNQLMTTWETDSVDFYVRLIHANAKGGIWFREVGADTWNFISSISLTASGAVEHLRIQAASRRPREYLLEGGNMMFGGLILPASDNLQAARPLEDIVFIFGDSYSLNTGGDGSSPWSSAPATLIRSLGYTPYIYGISGSGWLSTSPTIAARAGLVPMMVRRNFAVETKLAPEFAVTMLGYNDAAGSQTTIGTNITSFANAMRAQTPAVPLVFFGPWTPLGDTGNLTTTAATISAKATELVVPFVPMNGIVTSANKTNATSGDNVHPAKYGHDLIGYRGALSARSVGAL